MKPLSDIEWTTCWMAVRYAMGRQTIASVTLPELIIKNYFYRLSESQKKLLVADMKEHLNRFDNFGDKNIDNPVWMKFLSALDTDKHVEVELADKSKCIGFKANGRIYPLKEYVENPFAETFIPDEAIVKGGDKDED